MDNAGPPILNYGTDTPRNPRWKVVKVIIASLFAGFAVAVAFDACRRWETYPRERGFRVQCGRNLRQIGVGIERYHGAHGEYPASLADLLGEDLKPSGLICPSTRAVAASGSAEQIDSLVRQGRHCSYIYRRPPENPPSDLAVAYEACSNHGGDGANVLFADGHVEYFSAAGLGQALSQPASRPGQGE